MCDVDVLDLSVRCQPQQLPPVDTVNSWQTSTTAAVDMNTLPAWSKSTVNSTIRIGQQYELEPVSPSSSPDRQSPSYVDRCQLDAFYPRRSTADHASQHSPAAAAAFVTASTAQQPASSLPRRWNGNGGHPYSPLKRVLYQYCSSVAAQENGGTAAVPQSGDAGAANLTEFSTSPPPPTFSTVTSTANTCRKPTTVTTTAGMSFEEFVLGMLSKVGGGKAITASTQSYLRETAVTGTASNRGGTMAEVGTTGVDAAQPQSEHAQRPRYDDRSPYLTAADQQRRLLERQMLTTTIARDPAAYSPSSYHAAGCMAVTPSAGGLRYPPSRPSSDLRLITPPHQQPSLPLQPPSGTMMQRRLPPRVDDRDDAYRERRRKNNEAAKRSRDTRRFKELQVAAQAERLAEENLQLKAEIAVLRSQLGYLHRMMLDNNNVTQLNTGASITDGSDDARQDDQQHNSGHHQYPPEDGGRTV